MVPAVSLPMFGSSFSKVHRTTLLSLTVQMLYWEAGDGIFVVGDLVLLSYGKRNNHNSFAWHVVTTAQKSYDRYRAYNCAWTALLVELRLFSLPPKFLKLRGRAGTQRQSDATVFSTAIWFWLKRPLTLQITMLTLSTWLAEAAQALQM